MDERPEDVGVQGHRLVCVLWSLPSETVAPDEADRIPQEHIERRRRQRPLEQFGQSRMRRRDQAVVRRDVIAMPVAPARQSGDGDHG